MLYRCAYAAWLFLVVAPAEVAALLLHRIAGRIAGRRGR
jgi:hypothetical protein